MYFTRILPAAAVLVTAISATPVHNEHSPRQVGDLTGILKGIMNLGGGSGGGSSSTGTTGTTGTVTSADTLALQQCSDAISKIEAALSMSASYMKAAGGAPTPQEIQAVLMVLEQSLGADCDDDMTRRGIDIDLMPTITGDDYDTNQSMNEHAGTAPAAALLARNAEDTASYSNSCSDCERQLYHIVKELQVIFKLGAGAGASSDLSGMSSSIAAVPTTTLAIPLSDITNLPNFTGTSLNQITGMSRAD